MDNTIIGVYFICCKHNYIDIVKEQLEIVNKGLFQITKKLILFITEYNKDTCIELDAILNTMLDPNKCIRVTSPDNLFEKFAINNYKQYITEKEYYLYYFHTKAIKPETDRYFQICSSRRKILNYYILLQYDISIKLLKTYDAVGCSLSLYPKKHLSGNFWWSKSSYLQHLGTINDKYLSPEMYILSNDTCKCISLANDTNWTLVENYTFPDKETIEKNVTTQYINNEEHKNLIYLCE
jgi:hypothetical protein